MYTNESKCPTGEQKIIITISNNNRVFIISIIIINGLLLVSVFSELLSIVFFIRKTRHLVRS